MANHFFRFKQFTVYQDKCALKVCTDACVFGAWTAERVIQDRLPVKQALDIGAGTGLLSLMLAQQLPAHIDAVEIAKSDFEQCSENFENAAWKERLQCWFSDIKQFQTLKTYELVIANPPFFANDLEPELAHRKRAKHDTHLTLKELFTEAGRLIHPAGYFSLLLPAHREAEASVLAEKNRFFPRYICRVQQTTGHSPFRVMLLFGRAFAVPTEQSLIIMEAGNRYTEAATALLQPYYLYL